MAGGVDIFRLLEKLAQRWDHIESGEQAIRDCIHELQEAKRHGYLGVLYRTDFEVEGSGPFPYDMLRYVQSYPSDEASAYAMAPDRDEKRVVKLSKYHRDARPVLGEDRWESRFHWRVVKKETVQL